MSKGFLLIVEDQADLREILSDLLTPEVEQVEVAANGKEALLMLEKNPYINCVLTDIQMPLVNGIDLIKFAREKKYNTPFIFLTAYGSKDYMQDALKYGAYDFLDKPFDVEKLVETVHQAIEINLRVRDHQNISDLINNESNFSKHYAQFLEDKKPL